MHGENRKLTTCRNIEAFDAHGFMGFVVCLVVCFCLKLQHFRHVVAFVSFKF